LGGGDGDDAGGTKEAVPDFVSPTSLVEDGAFGLARSRFLSQGFVEIRIKGFSQRLDGGDPVLGEEPFELGLDQFHPGHHRGRIGGSGGGLQSQLQMIEEGKKIGEKGLVGIAERLFLLADETLAGVFKIGFGPKKLVFEGSDFGHGIGCDWRGGRMGGGLRILFGFGFGT